MMTTVPHTWILDTVERRVIVASRAQLPAMLFEGRVFDIERGARVACARCTGSGRVVVYLYPKLKRRTQ